MNSVRAFITRCIDTLFPPEREEQIVRSLSHDDVVALLAPHTVGDYCIALTDFREARVRALIHEAKFHKNARAQELLGHMLAAYLSTQSHDAGTVVIPIPLSPARLRERGYNQVLEVLRSALKNSTSVTCVNDVLVRTRNTQPQTELTKHEREQNVAGAFSVMRPETVRGVPVILVDDVVTTGATMRAAALALKPHTPASITCLAFAH